MRAFFDEDRDDKAGLELRASPGSVPDPQVHITIVLNISHVTSIRRTEPLQGIGTAVRGLAESFVCRRHGPLRMIGGVPSNQLTLQIQSAREPCPEIGEVPLTPLPPQRHRRSAKRPLISKTDCPALALTPSFSIFHQRAFIMGGPIFPFPLHSETSRELISSAYTKGGRLWNACRPTAPPSAGLGITYRLLPAICYCTVVLTLTCAAGFPE